MQQDLSEVGKVLEPHEYSMATVLLDAAKTFKLPSIIKKAGFEKAQGYSVTEIIMLMMLLPFVVLNRVNDLFTSHFREITAMRKDATYRLQNDERIPWRAILYGVVRRFQRLVNPQKTVAPNSALIADDTTDARTRSHIATISCVFDPVEGPGGLGSASKISCWAGLMERAFCRLISVFIAKSLCGANGGKRNITKPVYQAHPARRAGKNARRIKSTRR